MTMALSLAFQSLGVLSLLGAREMWAFYLFALT